MRSKIFILAVIFIISGVVSAQEKPEPAGKIMNDAYKTAARERKNVMIVFHASWCGWCKKFEASVTDPACKDFFDKHFVIKYLDILERADKKNLENPDAMEIYNNAGGKDQGIPYFLIFDKNKTLIADSKIKTTGDGPDKPLQNIGCPSSDDEVAAFIKILEKAAKISPAEKTAITERFRKNGK
jgi:thiol-disulfide isomerase/thioredoxin